jgi:hypothetical protein
MQPHQNSVQLFDVRAGTLVEVRLHAFSCSAKYGPPKHYWPLRLLRERVVAGSAGSSGLSNPG